MLVFFALSLAGAAVEPETADQVAPSAMVYEASSGLLCKSEVVTGTIVPLTVCKTAAQWQEEMQTDDPDQVELVAEYGVRQLNSWED